MWRVCWVHVETSVLVLTKSFLEEGPFILRYWQVCLGWTQQTTRSHHEWCSGASWWLFWRMEITFYREFFPSSRCWSSICTNNLFGRHQLFSNKRFMFSVVTPHQHQQLELDWGVRWTGGVWSLSQAWLTSALWKGSGAGSIKSLKH